MLNTETRRTRASFLLSENPLTAVAVVTDEDCSPEVVSLAIAVRGESPFEWTMPKSSFNAPRLIDLIGRYFIGEGFEWKQREIPTTGA